MQDTNLNQQITAVVRRRIKAGAEAEFEMLMQGFMAFVLKQPGHQCINVIRPSQGVAMPKTQ
jgi:antibiotic biosynthesis monooxygenase (ABM) superfamily enzyme